MPPLEVIDLVDDALLWVATGAFDNDGKPVVAATYAEIKVRWLAGKRESLNPNSEVSAWDATVLIDRLIPIKSILWRGKASDLPGTAADMVPTTDLFEVFDYRETPDLKGINVARQVRLLRHSNQFPPQA